MTEEKKFKAKKGCGICGGDGFLKIQESLKGGGFGKGVLKYCKCVNRPAMLRLVEEKEMNNLTKYKCKNCLREETRDGAPTDPCCSVCGGKMEIIQMQEGDSNDSRKED